jgi:hypothetical protein
MSPSMEPIPDGVNIDIACCILPHLIPLTSHISEAERRNGARIIVTGLTATEQGICSIMADRQATGRTPVPQTPGLAERLVQHAKTIRNPAAAAAMGDDMREAARIIEEWRAGIREAIETTADDTTRARLTKLLEAD